MNTQATTVHIVDDDEAFRVALARLLRAAGHRVQTYSCAKDFLDSAVISGPGCVTVDLDMPGTNGLELQDALAAMENPLPVIFLTGQGDIPTTVRAMRRGAEDFLTKLAPREELLNAVTRALARDVEERFRRNHVREVRKRLTELSPREREVLALVVRGKLNKQIAAELGIHERTVKLHRTSITTKLRVPSVAGLTLLVQEAAYRAEGGLVR
jgi:two-component system response regulator FixJ